MNPKMLSVHYTAECAKRCAGCYLEPLRGCNEIDKSEWLKLPTVALSAGIEKIAIAVNDPGLKPVNVGYECIFAADFINECSKNKIKADITTIADVANYLYMYDLNDSPSLFSKIDVFSISVDHSKVPGLRELSRVCKIAEGISKKGIGSLNANFLINRNGKIKFEWFRELLKYFNTVHIIFEKPFPYSKDEYYTIIESMDKHGIFEDERFIVDPCVLFRMGLVNNCHSCSYMVDISPNGDVAGCVYSHCNYPIGNVNKMEDLPDLLEQTEEMLVTNCDFLEFVTINENNEERCSNSH